MIFHSAAEATERLRSSQHALTDEEIRAMLPWVRALPADARIMLETELALVQLRTLTQLQSLAERQITSFDKFDTATKSANRWMLRFTAAVTLMTLVLVIITAYPLMHQPHNAYTEMVESKQTASVGGSRKIEEVEADPGTWSTAEMMATCSSTSHMVPAYTMDGKNKKQVTLNCTVTNRTGKAVPLAAFNKTDALFKDSTGRIVRGTAYLASATATVPARGEVQGAGLYLGHDDCPAQQPDVDCVKSELMDSREILLTDTVTGTRYDIHIE